MSEETARIIAVAPALLLLALVAFGIVDALFEFATCKSGAFWEGRHGLECCTMANCAEHDAPKDS